MGLKLSKVVKSLAARAPQIVQGFAQGGFVGAGAAAIAPRPKAPVGAAIPNIGPAAVPFAAMPAVMRFDGNGNGNGGMMPVGAPGGLVAAGVAAAVFKLAQRLGLALQPTVQSVTRVGMRIWQSVSAFAARHPGVSVLTLLTGLGLTAQEAAEFMLWGSRRRKRRRRGISAADLRTTKRTVRRVLSIVRDLRGITAGGTLGAARRSVRGRRNGTIIAQTS